LFENIFSMSCQVPQSNIIWSQNRILNESFHFHCNFSNSHHFCTFCLILTMQSHHIILSLKPSNDPNITWLKLIPKTLPQRYKIPRKFKFQHVNRLGCLEGASIALPHISHLHWESHAMPWFHSQPIIHILP